MCCGILAVILVPKMLRTGYDLSVLNCACLYLHMPCLSLCLSQHQQQHIGAGPLQPSWLTPGELARPDQLRPANQRQLLLIMSSSCWWRPMVSHLNCPQDLFLRLTTIPHPGCIPPLTPRTVGSKARDNHRHQNHSKSCKIRTSNRFWVRCPDP